jgi:hypothetical protein
MSSFFGYRIKIQHSGTRRTPEPITSSGGGGSGGPAVFTGLPLSLGLKQSRCEPGVDSFGDCLPSRLKHHVVPHVGEDLCLGTVYRSGAANLALGDDDGVIFGSQYEHRDAVDLFRLDQIEGKHVKEGAVGLSLSRRLW